MVTSLREALKKQTESQSKVLKVPPPVKPAVEEKKK